MDVGLFQRLMPDLQQCKVTPESAPLTCWQGAFQVLTSKCMVRLQSADCSFAQLGASSAPSACKPQMHVLHESYQQLRSNRQKSLQIMAHRIPKR